MKPVSGPAVGLVLTVLAGALLVAPSPAATPGFGGFLENNGQLDDRVHYTASGSSTCIYFTAEGLVLDVFEPIETETVGESVHDDGLLGTRPLATAVGRRGHVIEILFDGATDSPAVEGRGERSGRYHFFSGSNPANWHTGARVFKEILYRDVWPGIDLVFRAAPGELQYDALVHAGADPSLIRFAYEGTNVVGEPEGEDRLGTSVGDLIHRLPVPGIRSGAILRGEVGARNPVARNSWGIDWCTFLGGSDRDHGLGVIADDLGRPVVVGQTWSSDFPTTPGVYDSTWYAFADAYITKLTADGTDLVWSTLLGGGGEDAGVAAALDSSGNLVVTGATTSADFPTTPGAFDPTASAPADDIDVFAAKLSADGDSLLWSTYLEGDKDDINYDLRLDSSDNVLLMGQTKSSGWPTTPGAYKETHDGDPNSDAFVTKLASTGDTLVWSTLLGDDGFKETAWSFDLDFQENVVIGGATWSPNFPTTAGAYDTTYTGGVNDGFLAKISADGTSLVWSTFVGGTTADQVFGLALDSSGDVLAAARTNSANFPVTPGAFDLTYNGPSMDTVVLRMSAAGDSLIWSTFLGGTGGATPQPGDWAGDIEVGPSGTPVVVGSTSSVNFPTTPDAFQPTYGGGHKDGFITAVKNDGSDLLYSTFFGGSDNPGWEGFAFDGANMVYVNEVESIFMTGIAQSTDFPSFPEGVWDRTRDGAEDAVVLMMMLPVVDAPVLPPPTADRLHLTCSPNPFRKLTSIRYTLPAAASVVVTVHDTAGRRVRALHTAHGMPAGPHLLSWDGRNDLGASVAAGIYFLRLETPDHRASQRLVRLR